MNPSKVGLQSIIAAGIAVGLAMAIGIIAFSLMPQQNPAATTRLSNAPVNSTPFKGVSNNQTYYFNANRPHFALTDQILLDTSICGQYQQENGPENTPGTFEDPVVVHRGQAGVTVPLCFRSGDPVQRTYSLTVTYLLGEPAYRYRSEMPQSFGLQATLDKTTLTIPPEKPFLSNVLAPVIDHANLFLRAYDNATIGYYLIIVQASFPDAIGQSVNSGHPVYLRIE